MSPPILPQSPRLLYAPFLPEDLPDYLAMSTHPDVMAHITGEPLSEAAATERYEKLLRDNAQHPNCCSYRVVVRETQQFMGFGKVVWKEGHNLEIGYAMMPEHWGKGYGTEIGKAMLDHALRIPKVRSVIGLIDPRNEASRRILLGLGMTLRDRLPVDGQPCETYHLIL